MANNKGLTAAKTAKNDEFFTFLTDIEKECKYYKEYFRGKTILCNCDDPRVSNFYRYFSMNFEHLGLRKLICTCYKNNNVDLFSQNDCEQAVYTVYEGDKNGNHQVDPDEVQVFPLKGDGDFRSEECVNLLKISDIVVTNPPFSLFREFISLMMKYEKEFLVIGNTQSVMDKDIFPYVKADKMWVGVTNYNVGMMFALPDHYKKFHHIDEDGRKIGRVSTSCWWTNIDNKRHNERLDFYKHYSPEEYPKYDNFDAIEVKTYTDIPEDYDGVMGVPPTFMGHYNPEQFEIVGRGGDIEWCESECDFYTPCSKEKAVKYKNNDSTWRIQNPYLLVNGEPKIVYSRIFIKHKR